MFDLLLDVDFIVAAFVVLVTLQALTKKTFASVNQANRVFYNILTCAIFTCIINILMNISATYVNAFSSFLYLIFRLLFNCGTSGISYLGYVYARVFQNGNKSKQLLILDWIARGAFAIHAILSVVNIFTGVIAYIGTDGKLHHGPLFNINSVVPVIIFLSAMIVVYGHKSDYTKKQRVSIVVYYTLTFVFVLLELLTHNRAPLSMFGISISLIILQQSLVSPEYMKLEKAMKDLKDSNLLLEKATERENERVRTMHQLMRTASWVLYFDQDGNVNDGEWSEEFLWMLGYNKENVEDEMYELWEKSLHPDDHDAAMKAFMDGMAGVSAFDIDYRLRDKNDQYRWYRGTGELKRDFNGTPTSYQGVIQDITEKKMNEILTQEKIAVLDDLQKSEEALKDALNEAQEANRSKSRFLSNMSHDIRTPMNAVVGFTDLAIQNIDDKDQVKDYLSKIQVSGNHLLSLINDILDMSRIESGKVTIEETKENICTIVESIDSMIAGEAKKRGLAYNSEIIDVSHPIVNCDALRLRQVLLNCLGNSVKFTNEGNVSFSLKELPEMNSDLTIRQYEFKISDTGIGMTQEFLKHVFEPFEREKSSTISKTQGTGLGMSITKSLVDLMGGTINIDSELNMGTTYTITIPFKLANSDSIGGFATTDGDLIDSLNVKDSGVSTSEKEEFLKGKHLLLVDDNATNRLVARGLLKTKGITIEEADNGDTAVQILKNAKASDFDAVLMDIQMPIMSGYEATDIIRGFLDNEISRIPILAMTANAFEEDKQECIAHGMNAHVAKPFKIEALVNVLYEILK